MFPRSERFVEKIEITPGPNHYDVKNLDDDPYKRFGFLGKTKRFDETTATKTGGPNSHGIYERNSLSASLPSLIVDDGARSPDTASVHSNGSTTPDYTRRPHSTLRSKSSDKLGSAFAANSSRVEERLRRELAELTERFEKARLAHQRDIDNLTDKQRKGEAMYQSCIREKNSALTQLAAKESEIASLDVKHNVLKATLEKSERAAAQATDKITKANQLQKRIEELEKLNARSKIILQEQESITQELRKKHNLEREQLEQQFLLQKTLSEQEMARLHELHLSTDTHLKREIQQAQDEAEDWKRKIQELEQIIKELERQLAKERKRVAELEEQLRRERERLGSLLKEAHAKLDNIEQEKTAGESASKETILLLTETKQQLQEQLQKTNHDLDAITNEHQETIQTLEQEKAQHADTIKTLELEKEHHVDTIKALEQEKAQHADVFKILEQERAQHANTMQSMAETLEEQKAHISRQQQSHKQALQDLQTSINSLITELAQNRSALLEAQRERSILQQRYDKSQEELDETCITLEDLKEQFQQLKLDSEEQQRALVQKLNLLTEESAQQKQVSAQALEALNTVLDQKSRDYDQILATANTVQAELKAVSQEKEEVMTLRQEEEKKANETRQKLQQAEQENMEALQQIESLTRDKEAFMAEHEKLKETSNAQIMSINALLSEIEQVKTEKAERETKDQARIQELEDANLVATKQVETFYDNEKVWESERVKLVQESKTQEELIESLQVSLEEMAVAKNEESNVQLGRIKELEEIVETKEQASSVQLNRIKELEEIVETKEQASSAQSNRIKELEEIEQTKEQASNTQLERIKELEAKCLAMEMAFKDLHDSSANTSPSPQETTVETDVDVAERWKKHSAGLMEALQHYMERCSLTKNQHKELVATKEELEKTVATLTATVREYEASVKRTHGDQSGLLEKIAELEDQIRQLQIQVEFLEAENIGKVAIVKALQDEYEYQEKVIRELSKNEDAAKEVPRLEEELRTLTNHTREMDEWIKQVQKDVEKYKAAYIKADIAREETLLDMANLHEQLAESESARLHCENQLNVEVGLLVKKHELSSDELSRLSKMNVDSAQNQGLKHKVKQIALLKEENLALKKKNLALSNTRDSLRLKCLRIERDLESYKTASLASTSSSSSPPNSGSTTQSSASRAVTPAHRKHSSTLSSSSVVSSSSALLGSSSTLHLSTSTDQIVGSKLQLQSEPSLTPRSTSPMSTTPSSPIMTPKANTCTTRPRSSSTLSSSKSIISSSSPSSSSTSTPRATSNTKSPKFTRTNSGLMSDHSSTKYKRRWLQNGALPPHK
ncbi:hypothetical protein BGZ94_000616 [Podila epigama]|nr:hypothetical protein BGZ94_000616 [Podila epigama]